MMGLGTSRHLGTSPDPTSGRHLSSVLCTWHPSGRQGRGLVRGQDTEEAGKRGMWDTGSSVQGKEMERVGVAGRQSGALR